MPNRTKGRKRRADEAVADRRTIEKADAQNAWREYLASMESEREKTARLRVERLAHEKRMRRKAPPKTGT